MCSKRYGFIIKRFDVPNIVSFFVTRCAIILVNVMPYFVLFLTRVNSNILIHFTHNH